VRVKKKRTFFCLSCYGPNANIFVVPLRASEVWLKRVLKRRDLVDGTPLRKSQFEILRRRVTGDVEVGWSDSLEYVLESMTVLTPNHALVSGGLSAVRSGVTGGREHVARSTRAAEAVAERRLVSDTGRLSA